MSSLKETFDYDDIFTRLDAGYLVAIRDVHTTSSGREIALELLKSGHVKTFFFEWSNEIGINGRRINDYLSDVIGSNYDDVYKSITENYFKKLAKQDANPTIPELVAHAISNGARAIAADADPQYAMESIRKAGDGGGVDGKTVGEQMLFQPSGLKHRDIIASDIISNHIVQYVQGLNFSDKFYDARNCLVLWGSNHFDHDVQNENADKPQDKYYRMSILSQIARKSAIGNKYILLGHAE